MSPALLRQACYCRAWQWERRPIIVDSVHIFIAIAAHKGLAAYALGSSVVDSQVCCPTSQAWMQWKLTKLADMTSGHCMHEGQHVSNMHC